MVIHDKFIYIHMPKTGGTFVSYYLQDNVPGSNYFMPGSGHQPVSSQRLTYPNHFMFGTIRNPWDWYVSVFQFDVGGGNYAKAIHECDDDFNKFVTMLLTKTKGAISRIRFNRTSELNIGMCTYQYLLLFGNKQHIETKKEMRQENMGLDYIIKIEDIVTELPKMFKNFIFELSEEQKNVLTNMKKLNTSKSWHENYRDYYTEETKELVRKKDRFIIEKYNYSF